MKSTKIKKGFSLNKVSGGLSFNPNYQTVSNLETNETIPKLEDPFYQQLRSCKNRSCLLI